MPTREEYEAAFAAEAANVYPAIDAFETETGFAIGPRRLESAARVLACPVKANPPCWQHGRVLYAAARRYLDGYTDKHHPVFLDIGTAKGFSALMMAWATWDAKRPSEIISLDVVDPLARVPRNSIADLSVQLSTVPELVAPFCPAGIEDFEFFKSPSQRWLRALTPYYRINFAFVDGKHSEPKVCEDANLIFSRQNHGDVIVFDDMQLPAVRKAAAGLPGYDVTTLTAHAERAYAVAVRR